MNRALTLLMASLLSGAAAAPTAALRLLTPPDPTVGTPKLTSVGERLLWMVGDQTLTLDVLERGPVTVTLAHPALEGGDYRRPGAYGDERYTGAATQTAYTLTGPGGATLADLHLTPGPAGARVLYAGTLDAGRYQLTARSSGAVKNTFAAAASGAVRVSAEEVNLTLRSPGWLDLLSVAPGEDGAALRLYDSDGPAELELRLVGPGGEVRPVPGGGPLAWSALDLPAGPGSYRLQARQPAGARQYSNTLGVALMQGGVPVMITLQDAPAAGSPTAEAQVEPAPPAVPQVPDTGAEPVGAAPTEAPVTPQAAAPAPQPMPPALAAPVPAATPAEPPPAPSAALPTPVRESLLRLPYEAPQDAAGLVLAATLPGGATYLPGSSRVGGQPVNDPLVGPSGRLYWPLPGGGRGALTFRAQQEGTLPCLPEPALLVRYGRDRQETLQGAVDLADLAAATSPVGTALAENAGAIKLPLDGSVVRGRDRVSVVVEGPAGAVAVPTINGEALGASAIGQRGPGAGDGTERVTYYGIRLRGGPNTLALGAERVQVYAAGAPTRAEVRAVQDLADGSTPLRVSLRALDASGVAADVTALTVRSSIEPAQPDADPLEGGFQVALRDGVGELVLAPQGAPGTLTLDVLVGDEVQRHSVAIRPAVGTFGVGAATATLGLGPAGPELRAGAGGYFEGTVGGGKLYAAGNSAGLPGTADPTVRYGLYGDASSEDVPLQGQDPVAFRYDHPAFSAQYRLSALPIDVLPVGETLTALSVTTKGPLQVGAFAALVGRDRVTGERLRPDGTRLLRLGRGDIAPDSETLELVTLDAATGAERARRPLTRFADYVLDPVTGVVTLSGALTAVDGDLNPQEIVAAYRLSGGEAGRTLAYGAQAKYSAGSVSVGVAAVQLDGRVTAGAQATVQSGALRASAQARTGGGGVQLGAEVGGQLGGALFSVRAAYQDQAYAGLAPQPVGLRASASARRTLRPGVNVSAGADLARSPGTGDAAPTRQANLYARADAQLGAFSVGGGLRGSLGDQTGVSALLGLGYHAAPLDVDLTHSQTLTGNVDPQTVFTARYALTPQIKLRVTDAYNWNLGHTASVGLDSTLGGTNLSASYELPNAAGAGNRARFGADTTLALNSAFSVGLRGAATRDLGRGAGDLSVGADLRYRSERLSASVGGDVSLSAGKLRTVLRAGATGAISENFSLSADALTEFSVTPGRKLSLGYAYRGGAWSSLGNVRYQGGSLAGDAPQLTTQLAAEYHAPRLALRGGLDTRTLLDDPGSLTVQPSVSGTFLLSDRFGLGLSTRALIQPSTGLSAYGLGVEGSVRVLPGTWLTGGYNLRGFDGLGSAFTKPGPYLRLDLLVDEGGKK